MVKCMYTTFTCFLINHKTEKLVNELEFVHALSAITLTRSPVTMQFDFFQNSDLIWVQESRLFYTSSIRDLTVTLTIKVLRTSHGHTNWKLHDTQHVTLSRMSCWQRRGYDVTLWWLLYKNIDHHQWLILNIKVSPSYGHGMCHQQTLLASLFHNRLREYLVNILFYSISKNIIIVWFTFTLHCISATNLPVYLGLFLVVLIQAGAPGFERGEFCHFSGVLSMYLLDLFNRDA